MFSTATAAYKLVRDDGETWLYHSKKALVKDFSFCWLWHNVGLYFNEQTAYGFATYIFLDPNGRPISVRTLYNELVKTAVYKKGGTVPGIRRHRGGHYYRRIRFIGDLRNATVFKEDGEPKPRGARSISMLPDNWDDYAIKSRGIDNWKRYRKHQYKG